MVERKIVTLANERHDEELKEMYKKIKKWAKRNDMFMNAALRIVFQDFINKKCLR